MSEGTSTILHHDKFDSIIMNFTNIDVTIENEDQALLLLCSLFQSFKHFRHIMFYGKDTNSYKEINSILKSKEHIGRDIIGETRGSQKDALLVRGRSTHKIWYADTIARRAILSLNALN